MELTTNLREILDTFEDNRGCEFWCHQIEVIFNRERDLYSSLYWRDVTPQLHAALCEMYPEIFPPERKGVGSTAERWISNEIDDEWESSEGNLSDHIDNVRAFRIWLAGKMRTKPEMLDRTITFKV